MKRRLSTSLRLLLSFGLLCLLMHNTAFAALSGTYTIDASKTASSSNYQNFASAMSDMVSGSRSDGGTANGSGISGSVIFKVANGSYNEQLSLSAVSGASSSNTITFESASGDSTKVRLYYASSSSSTNDYVLELNGADYVTFKSMTIERTGTAAYGKVIVLTGGALHNRFLNNHFIGKYIPSTSTFQGGNDAIIYSASADSANLIQNNHFTYGFDGVYLSSSATGNKVIGNIFDTTGSSSIYCLNQTNFVIDGNTMNLGPFAVSAGHYVSYGIRLESSPYLRITNNKIYCYSNASVVRGIVLFSCTSSTSDYGLIANNWIWVDAGTTSSTALALGGNSYLDVYYNNFLVTATVSGSAVFYLYPPTQPAGQNNNLVNNNLINKGGGYVYSISGNTSGIGTVDYNNGYTSGTNFGNWNGTNYTSLSAWQSASSQDGNTLSGDPAFVSNMDLHVTSSKINGKATPYSRVTKDIDGETRNSSTPDIGADEFTPIMVDAGVTKLDSPSFFCSGSRDVYVRFTNFGVNSLTSATINWSVNGTTQTSYSWSGTVTSGNASASIKLGSYNFATNTPYTLKIWTSAPNSTSDGANKNDTLTTVVRTGMSGSYTIGGSSPDFVTWNDAVIAATNRGLCGPVVFNVRDGVYNHQVSIPPITGASATNTITFQSQSKDSTKVIIDYASTTATGVNDAVFQLNGADYIRVKGITFYRSGSNPQAYVIDIRAGSTNNIFEGNRFIGRSLTSTVATADLVISVNGQDTANTFRNNLFKYGNNGLTLTGTSSARESHTLIEDNIFDSVLLANISANYNDKLIIRNNRINNGGRAGGSVYGIYVDNCSGGISVLNNEVIMPNGATAGMYLSNCQSSSSNPSMVANNFISIVTGTQTSPFGISHVGSNYMTYAFNSIHITGTNSGYAFYDNSASASSKNNLYNNIFSNESSYAIFVSSGSYYDNSNYNNFYSNGKYIAHWGGSDYSSFSGYQSGSSKDQNSLNVNPYFKSATDLHTQNSFFNAKATPISGITKDIDGDTRNSSTPDIGADEFDPLANEAGILGLSSPKDSLCGSTQDVLVTLNNYGSDPLKSVTIDWSINGTAQTSYSWTGNLSAYSSTVVNLGSYNFSTSGQLTIKMWTSSPNSVTDGFPYNDTAIEVLKVLPGATANAGTDQNVCSGNLAVIGSFTVPGLTYTWSSNPSGFSSNKSNDIVNPTVTTTYYLHVINSSGCEDEDSVVITVLPAPTPNAGNDQQVCAGTSVNLGGSATTGNTYSWTSNPSGFTSSSSSITVSPTVTTTYYLEETDGNSNCAAIDSVTITIRPGPTADAGADRAICSGIPTQIGYGGSANANYNWSSLPVGFTSTSSNPTVSPTATTTYILRATDQNTGCVSIDSVTLTVLTKPQPKINGRLSVCAGDTFIYNTPPNTGSSFEWRLTGGTLISGQNTNSVTIAWNTPGTAELSVKEQIGSNGCEDSVKQAITVTAMPVATFTAKTEACINETLSFNNTSVNGQDFFWTFGDGGSSLDQAPTHKYTAAGSYEIKLTVTAGSGCASTFTQNIEIKDFPDASFTAAPVCVGNNMTFVNTSQNAATYKWYFGDGGTSDQKDPIHTYASAGTYTVSIVAYSSAGCKDSSTTNVKVNPLPNAGWTMEKLGGRNIRFKSDVTNGTSYTWSFGDGDNGNGTTVEHEYSANGNYQVKLTVIDANGCENSRDSTIKVEFSGIDDPSAGSFPVSVYPNPFSDAANLQYELPGAAMVRISVMDITGKEVAEIYKGQQQAGSHLIPLGGQALNLQPGMYFIRFSAEGYSLTVKSIVKVE